MTSVAMKRVKARLDELGWNHADLARAMRARGVTVAEGLVSHWLNGRHAPGALRASVLDEVLGLDVIKLWRVSGRGKAA